MTQRGQQDNGHYSSNDRRITTKQTSTQTLKDKLRQVREEGAPLHIIADLGKLHAKEKQELLELQHQGRHKTVTDALALAVSYSLRYDKHHSNPTLCRSPVEMLNLWKSCVLPHFLID